MAKKIRFAVVGCGHIGKRHAALIVKNANCELVALCDHKSTDELSLQDFGSIPFFSTIQNLLSAEINIDVVCVCTPNGLHEEHTLLALKNAKHVVCEKPMALTKVSCELMIQQADKAGKRIFCVMQNRYSPPAAWLKEVISKKLIGTIFQVQINCFWNRDNRYYKSGDWKGNKVLDGGTLFTQFSHFVDMMYWLFGDITKISAIFRDFNHQNITEFEDSGLVTFEFIEGGGMGSINYSTAVYDKNLESSITIIGEHGSVKVGGQYMNEVQYCHIKDYVMPELLPSNPPNDYGYYKGSAANHHFVFDNVVNTLNGIEEATTNAKDGLKVVEIIERIYNASADVS